MFLIWCPRVFLFMSHVTNSLPNIKSLIKLVGLVKVQWNFQRGVLLFIRGPAGKLCTCSCWENQDCILERACGWSHTLSLLLECFQAKVLQQQWSLLMGVPGYFLSLAGDKKQTSYGHRRHCWAPIDSKGHFPLWCSHTIYNGLLLLWNIALLEKVLLGCQVILHFLGQPPSLPTSFPASDTLWPQSHCSGEMT